MARRRITRRDFLDGARFGVAGVALARWTRLLGCPGPPDRPGPYPPAATGMRGSHDGSWEVAHALVSGRRFEAEAGGEDHDLVVVGGGITRRRRDGSSSGPAAASP